MSSQQILLGSGGSSDSPVYVDNLFNIDLYHGSDRPRSLKSKIALGTKTIGNYSVDFDGDDYLYTTGPGALGTSTDFTMECWVKPDVTSGIKRIFSADEANNSDEASMMRISSGAWEVYIGRNTSNDFWYYNGGTVNASSWQHIALTRSGSNMKFFVDGAVQASSTGSHDTTITTLVIGAGWSSEKFDGKISNARFVKGQALYTSAFTPSTEPLTASSQGATASKVTLLCCNNPSEWGGTVSANTIAKDGDPTVSTSDVPFSVDIDAATGGIVWSKKRSSTGNHYLIDTVRGRTKVFEPNTQDPEATEENFIKDFNSNGFSLGHDTGMNGNADYVIWSWAKHAKFRDISEYSGTGSAQSISHQLGCIPGCMIVKKTDGTDDWYVYHRGMDPSSPEDYAAKLNTTVERTDSAIFWNDTAPTASAFTVGGADGVSENGKNYVCYLFAGGESTAATARSVDFDGSSDCLSLAATSDFNFGSGDWTIEGWWKSDEKTTGSDVEHLFALGNQNAAGGIGLFGWDSNIVLEKNGSTVISVASPTDKHLHTWVHIAVVKSGSTVTLYANGEALKSYTDSGTFGDGSNNSFHIGARNTNAQEWHGWISNLRVVKGTAVYTSSFSPPTEPLTNITNTKLLCCNNSSTTGSTVTPGTITSHGDPTASTDSPFDDPEAYAFGESGDQDVIKCGSYIGNGNASHTIELGWEPQFLMIKRIDDDDWADWVMLDPMRGTRVDSSVNSSYYLLANEHDAEDSEWTGPYPTATGFKLDSNIIRVNSNNSSYIFIAVRRPDSFCGKPAEEGTDVFAMDAPTGTASTPEFTSNFPVDFAIYRKPDSTQNWYNAARPSVPYELKLDVMDDQSAWANGISFDYSTGWGTSGQYTPIGDYQSWQWKRCSGFDCLFYTGNSTNNRQVRHSLGRVAEMVWVKNRGSSGNGWQVFNKYLNGGTNPHTYRLEVDVDVAEFAAGGNWGDASPSATHFTVGSGNGTNGGSTYIALLFASVDGISKCGTYDGSSSEQTITTGFAPRFLFLKCVTAANSWYVLDTTRGWASGNDQFMYFDSNSAQSAYEFGAPTSTGFTIPSGNEGISTSGNKYIYYCHA